MRPWLTSLAVLACLSAPADAQTCKKAPLPYLPDVFPEVVEGLGRQFYNRMDECYTNLYRPSDAVVEGGGLWAVVSVEPNGEIFLGEAAPGLAAHYANAGSSTITVDGWPVAHIQSQAGDEFVALRGSVRVSVVIKGGDGGPPSTELATAFFKAIFPNLPCG